MAHSGDWLPHGQEAFVTWSQKFVAGLSVYASDLDIDAVLVAAIGTGQAAFMADWNTLASKEKRASVNAARKTLVDNHRGVLRDFFNENLRYNKKMTDEIRGVLGVPVRDGSHTPIVVGDRRVVFDLESAGLSMVTLKCRDKDTGEKKILYGMSGITALYAYSPVAITETALLNESLLLTKVNHTFHAADSQRGQWLSVTACWQSKTGERGATAAIQSARVS
jgi:hypothetical protein